MLELSSIVLPDRQPPAEFIADVRSAEDFGVRTVWTYDHLTWPPLRDGPWHAAVPLLAAAAMATDRVRLGTQVATPNFRHPVPFAKELMTLDQLSAGRLELGVGAGSESADAAVLGDRPRTRRERTDRFAEWVGLLDHLLTHPVSTVRGERYTAIEARQMPGCVQRPRVPFTVAAAGPRALRLAARHGQAWVTYGPYGAQREPETWFAALEDQQAALRDALAEAHRPAGAVRRVVQLALDLRWPFESAARYQDTVGRLAAIGFDEITVHWCRPGDAGGVPAAALGFLAEAHGR
ncbi:LLM class flavin-dependent oxidoreductase [Actinomadura alba]|uniref:LLM class flavin-dependent oxidoreductase n=1 Tax=Actinomadura alba TaxID=406431 RepID=A0ABR7LXM0_9ACTN|nr:LLM class flavin-dependent oxidoreductase [Actinomadura alba]MBC6469242.1 LLM class flavin-dependent oxidoreductase [Actinomadura alba]